MFKITKQTKIILTIVLVIIFIFTYQFLSKPKIDTHSYVTLVSWEASLNNNPLIIKQKQVLQNNDRLKTGGSWSLAIIEWGEWSITRIGPDTEIVINKANVSEDLTKIEILFNLIWDSWKTWSDVVSFIWEDSYFKEWFADTEAAVRGTIFEVNLDKDYLYVEKHEVVLEDKKNQKKYIIPEKKPFNIKLFDFVALEKFIISLRDRAWEDLNKQLDRETFKKLKENIKEVLDSTKQLTDLNNIDLNNLSQLDREKLYNELLSSYQKIKPSTITPADRDLYKYKLQYQEILTALAPEQDKENLLRTSIYDLKDAINLKNFEEFKNIMKYIWENKDFIDLKELDNVINLSWMKNSLKESIINFVRDTKNGNYSDLIWNSFKTFEELNFNIMNNTAEKIKNNLPDLKDLWNSINNLTNDLINK